MWCGWYISKEVNTSAVSASSDYYSAYVHSKLPPAASGWVTRAPGMSLTAGCGHNPPPSILEPLDTKSSPSKNDSRVVQFHKAESLVAEGAGCTEVFYRLVHVTGAGKELANGVYEFAGEMNHRPYYLKQLRGWTARGMSEDAAEGAEDDGTSSKGISSKDSSQREALWYFSDCPLNKSTSGLVSYNGWYLSKNIDTSSFSAGLDMYSCYVHSALPPMQGGWIARLPGLPPTAGCGKNPPPRVKYITTPLSAGSDADEMEDDATTSYLVQLLRIMLPSGQTISIDVCEHHTVGDVIIKLERHIHLLMRVCTPVYDIKLHCREAELKVYSKAVFACGIMKGDILVASFSPRKPLSVTHNISKRVQIIGAGPVGLWLAIHIKSYCPTWIVTCYERRLSYTRSHALRLDLQAFENMIAWVAGRPGAAELNMCQEKWFPRTRTAIVEEDLRLLAQSIGVSILYDTELNMQTILDQRQDRADIVICCDGARSGCRKELVALQDGKMRRELRGQMQLGSLLQVKFDALVSQTL
ncbi:hypothetical protein EON65_33520 [archaeon]|nr:MAG: hypothetical protein EON65_33520 [archaeon]